MRRAAGRLPAAAVCTAIAAGGLAAALAVVYIRRARRRTLPTAATDKRGNKVTIRLARAEDREQVASSIADQTGTGSGVGNDLASTHTHTHTPRRVHSRMT